MKLLGATVVPVTAGLRTLKEAVDSAFAAYLGQLREPSTASARSWTAPLPHAGPRVPAGGRIEAREQFLAMTGELPDNLVACVGGGNAMGCSRPSSTIPGSHGVEPRALRRPPASTPRP